MIRNYVWHSPVTVGLIKRLSLIRLLLPYLKVVSYTLFIVEHGKSEPF